MRTRVFVVAAGLALGVPVALAATNRPSGDLDPTFGTKGRFFLRPTARSSVEDAFVQADGRIVLAGEVRDDAGSGDFLVVRLTRQGRLDRSFGIGGMVRTPINLGRTGSDAVFGVAVEPDGHTVAAGYATDSDGVRPAFARYTASGALDGTFSGDGIETIALSDSAFVTDVALQADRKIVAGITGGWGFRIIRLHSNGELDKSFGSGGIIDTNVGDPAYRDHAGTVAVLPDGKIVVAGKSDWNYPSYFPVPQDIALVRYLPDGQRDPSFGEDGIVVTPGPQAESAAELAVGPDGRILVGGNQGWPSPGPRYPGSSRFHLVRYLPSGALDPTFGTGGKATTSFAENDYASSLSSVAIQPDGKVIAGGTHTPGGFPYTSTSRFAVARYSDDGTLDEAFGVHGKRTYQFAAGSAGARALGIQPSAGRSGADRLVVAGHGYYTEEGYEVLAIGVDLGPPPPPPPPVVCRVPRVVGLTLNRARARIRSAHCRLGRVRRTRSARPRGRVISQRPRAGRRLAKGSRVALVVSRGR